MFYTGKKVKNKKQNKKCKQAKKFTFVKNKIGYILKNMCTK